MVAGTLICEICHDTAVRWRARLSRWQLDLPSRSAAMPAGGAQPSRAVRCRLCSLGAAVCRGEVALDPSSETAAALAHYRQALIRAEWER